MPDEKTEEKNEKELEKREEKSAEEKYRRDPLGSIIWACILIWAGVVLLLNQLGYLDQIKDLLKCCPVFANHFDPPVLSHKNHGKPPGDDFKMAYKLLGILRQKRFFILA